MPTCLPSPVPSSAQPLAYPACDPCLNAPLTPNQTCHAAPAMPLCASPARPPWPPPPAMRCQSITSSTCLSRTRHACVSVPRSPNPRFPRGLAVPAMRSCPCLRSTRIRDQPSRLACDASPIPEPDSPAVRSSPSLRCATRPRCPATSTPYHPRLTVPAMPLSPSPPLPDPIASPAMPSPPYSPPEQASTCLRYQPTQDRTCRNPDLHT